MLLESWLLRASLGEFLKIKLVENKLGQGIEG